MLSKHASQNNATLSVINKWSSWDTSGENGTYISKQNKTKQKSSYILIFLHILTVSWQHMQHINVNTFTPIRASMVF